MMNYVEYEAYIEQKTLTYQKSFFAQNKNLDKSLTL